MSSATAWTGAKCSASETAVILTCEHGGNKVPRPWATLFEGCGELLASHRGWDSGALDLARILSTKLDAPLFFSTNTRLLVDLNRSLHHPRLFSEQTRKLSRIEKNLLVEKYYLPFRGGVENVIRCALDSGQRVLHLSIHSFTPVLDGFVRNAGLGLLYDPRHEPEQDFCLELKRNLSAALPWLRVRFNYPYRGVSDGHTTHLRRLFPNGYSGIEIEVNQGLLANGERPRQEIRAGLNRAIASLLVSPADIMLSARKRLD